MTSDYKSLRELILDKTQLLNFQEILNLDNKSISSYDVLKIEKIIDDLLKEIVCINDVFSYIEDNRESISNLYWYYEGRNELDDLVKWISSAETMLEKYLEILDSNMGLFTDMEKTLSLIEESAGSLLDCKRKCIQHQKVVKLAIHFVELTENVMAGLQKEVDECNEFVEQISFISMQESTDKHTAVDLDVEDFTAKMMVNMHNSNSVSLANMRFPAFNGAKDQSHETYILLQSRIAPLNVSFEYLPSRIADYNNICSISSLCKPILDSKSIIINEYEALYSKWQKLNEKLKRLKVEIIDRKWHEAFSYLIPALVRKCEEFEENFKTSSSKQYLNEEIGDKYKVCSNTFALISQAFRDGIVYDDEMNKLFNNSLIPKWEQLNTYLQDSLNLGSSFTKNNEHSRAGLENHDVYIEPQDEKAPKTIRKKYISSSNFDKPGFDLGIGINSATIPFSIKKKDKIVNIFEDSELRPISKNSSKVKHALLGTSSFPDKSKQDKDGSPLHDSSQKSSLSEMESLTNDFRKLEANDYGQFSPFNVLPHNNNSKSRIPRIIKDYIQLGYPVIKKKIYTDQMPSKIPDLSPDHPIFMDSPERSQYEIMKHLKFSRPKERAPLTPIRTNIHYEELDVFRQHSSKKSKCSSASGMRDVMRKSSFSLNGHEIPNLSYNKQPKYRSTSPERPSTSIGSRYDEQNLIQPIKQRKPSWK